MIGTNNTGHRHEPAQLTAAGIRTVLDELRSRLPETKILLLGVFPRDAEPGTPMRRINRKINEIIADYADNERIFYQEIYNEFLTGGGFIPAIVFSRAERDLIYARTDIGGAYRWQPDTQSWKSLLEWVGADRRG